MIHINNRGDSQMFRIQLNPSYLNADQKWSHICDPEQVLQLQL